MKELIKIEEKGGSNSRRKEKKNIHTKPCELRMQKLMHEGQNHNINQYYLTN